VRWAIGFVLDNSKDKSYDLSKLAKLEIFAMSLTKTIASTETQNNFGKILNDVIQNNTRYIIKRRSLPQAIILSLSDFEQLLTNHSDQSKMIATVRELAPVYKLGEEIQG
jgi:PHD/YefM family antitoxin component YafN of YafNO toxin-antitoxin module